MHAHLRACLAVLLLAPAEAAAQEAPLHTTDTGTPAGFKPIRYLEDGAALRLRFGEASYVSVGGQHRLRYEVRDRESALLSRNLLHVDTRLGPALRVFAQLGAFPVLGQPRAEQAPPDADDADVTQLFVETRAELRGVRMITRVGRQEMALGSTRWVSTRDGTNVRQSFDLVRTTLSGEGGWNVETFLGTTPRLRRGAFDDAPAWQEGFWGTYARIPGAAMSLEAFYLGRRRQDVTYRELGGREVRHTFGVRAFGETRTGLEYIAHGLVQVGRLGDADVLAWGAAGALWQRLPLGLRAGVRSDALSGDRRAVDGRVGTFHPLFPNQTFFSALPAIYPANLYDAHPLVRYRARSITLEGGCIFFWRQTVRDAVYEPPGAVLSRGNARYTGAQPSLSLAYAANAHLSFDAEYAHFFAAGGDVDFFGTWTTYTY